MSRSLCSLWLLHARPQQPWCTKSREHVVPSQIHTLSIQSEKHTWWEWENSVSSESVTIETRGSSEQWPEREREMESKLWISSSYQPPWGAETRDEENKGEQMQYIQHCRHLTWWESAHTVTAGAVELCSAGMLTAPGKHTGWRTWTTLMTLHRMS